MEVVGREGERYQMERFLDRLREGPAALVLEGDSGIGKTTLWRATVEAARARSYRVLICRPSESEGALSFLGLGDLLEGILDDALEALPEPQRLALKLALVRATGEGPPDRVAVARGTLAVLRASAAEAPTVVAVDDVQRLDPPSVDVLRFVVHRLVDERLGLAVSVHTDRPDALELDHAFPGGGLFQVRLEPLEFAELERVVRGHVPVTFTRPTWRALHRISEGNPFFAIQLAESLARRGGPAASEELPIPETLADAVRERLAGLTPVGRAALLPVAALAQPTLSVIQAGAAAEEGIEEAVRAGVLQLEGERVRFAHPLLASFVYGTVDDAERRAVHLRLAPLVTDEEESALHLGRGAVEPDERVAATLEARAERAAALGHPERAAELAEHSARLTPVERTSDRGRRVREAARFLYAAADGMRSRELLEELVEQLPPCEERARALRLLGWFVDDGARSTAILEQALRETVDLQLRSRLLSLLAMKEGWRGRWQAAARLLREAAELAERSGGGAPLATARARLAWVELAPDRLADIEQAVDIERSLPEPLPFHASPTSLRGIALLALDRLDDARRQLEDSYELALALGDSWRVVHLGWLAELELRAGNWERALIHASACDELGRQFGVADAETWAAATRALVEAHLGHVDAAVEAGERASRLAGGVGLRWIVTRSELALGFLHASAGRDAAALDRLLPLVDERAPVSLHPCLVARTLSNAVEALLGTGRLLQAEALAVRLDEHARTLPVPSAIAAAARSRAVVLAAGGDVAGARASIEEALAAHAVLAEPLELGRTLLASGAIERRAKRKAAAREELERAEAIFAELGARLWLDRARRDLARTGLTRSLGRELTPTERRVADLAAGGAQNKEIAGALFVSAKTVEANLSRIYAKLGVRSRVELAARLAPAEGRTPPAARPERDR